MKACAATVRSIALCAVMTLAPSLVAAQTVRSATGIAIASITGARDAFRTDLGGGTVAGPNGSFGGLRREINWDGVPAASAAPNLLVANFFNVNSPRGVVFATPGTGFQVSGATSDAGAGQPAAADFGNIDATYSQVFAPFSAQRLFTAVGSNITDVNFFVPGTTTAALTTGFGAAFSDVDLANTTSIQFFDAANVSLGTYFVPATVGSETFSFLGVSFPTAVVGRVRITSGSTALAAGATDQNGDGRDVVAMDDFIYGEPSVADLTISKTHAGNFTQGQIGATYTITVTNSGLAATAGTVTMTDTIPAGLTPTSALGTGWTCGVASQLVTCTRNDALASLATYPPITVTVNVAAGAAPSVINTAVVSGGGQVNTANDSASDPATVVVVSRPAVLVPTLDEPAMLLISALLALFALLALRRRA